MVDDATDLAGLMAELGYPATAAQMAGRLAGLAERADMATFAATDGDRILGFIGATVRPGLHADAPTGQIISLVVSETARGQGIGRRLVAEAETWMRAAGAYRVVVTSQNRRTEAHRFYVGLGYDTTGLRFAKAFGE
ncbi:MAG: GNAT family N-acetyltransferase [Hyphomicrobiales bacterium]|nr:GNAT family N-acetyltransferase [Hyphomicrobiales bacterium]